MILAAGAVIAALVAPVTGGTPGGEDAVVALVHGSVLVCSATAIAPHLVLTAAHCLSDAQLPDVVEGAALDGAHHAITATFVAPGFAAGTLDHDLALLVIDPALAATLPYATSLAAAPGDALTVIGFGFTVANDSTPAARRTGTSHLDTVDELRLQS
ncbi:MAG: trypsin-like serine protease, partial [Kofleriaceae bacterium]